MSRPNFVIVMTDTQATNVVGCYGHPDLQTPCIDRLASQGTRFDRAYTTCPVCTPARAAMFTGIYAHTAGPWTNRDPKRPMPRTRDHTTTDLRQELLPCVAHCLS